MNEIEPHSVKNLSWYVVHVYSAMEKSVRAALQERIAQSGMQEKFGRVLVPTEEVVEIKDGREIVTERRFYPGYVLIEMEMSDETWHLVNNTKGLMGFVGDVRKSTVGGRRNVRAGARPSPLSQAEVDQVLAQMKGGVAPRPKTLFRVGEVVRIKTEPFLNSNGSVEEVNYEKSRLRVSVTIFGRAVPVELEFSQVEKLSEFS